MKLIFLSSCICPRRIHPLHLILIIIIISGALKTKIETKNDGKIFLNYPAFRVSQTFKRTELHKLKIMQNDPAIHLPQLELHFVNTALLFGS